MGLRLKSEKILVKDNTDRVTKAESSIEQQATLIALKVSNEVYNSLVDRVASAESSISLQADAIALRVKSEDFNGNTVASLINQTATTIKLQANKIKLEGLVTANNNFKILLDGSIEAVNAKLSGSITATKMVSSSNPNYYGEVGVADGRIGMGLYDLNYSSKPYFRVTELKEEAGFSGFHIYDELGQLRIAVRRLTTRIYGPSGNSWIWLSPDQVTIGTPNKQETW